MNRFALVLMVSASVGFAEAQTNSTPAASTSTNSAEKIEAAYQALLLLDDAALTEVQNRAKTWNAQEGSGLADKSEEDLRTQMQFKIGSVRKAYEDFLRENPSHVRAMIAYGSFLCDLQEEEEGVKWWLKAREIDPKNAAARNNLANHYGHSGEPKRAIEEYEAAIGIQPSEPVYYFNLANTIYLFRKEAAELKKWSEDQVFEHALESFRKARDLEPNNYDYAVAYAETFYGLKKPNWQRALDAWNYCLKLDLTPLQRDQIHTHLARINLRLHRNAKARQYLNQIQSEQWEDLKQRLLHIANQPDSESNARETLRPDSGKE